jgi:DNA-binding XRE family transcriptional regulator
VARLITPNTRGRHQAKAVKQLVIDYRKKCGWSQLDMARVLDVSEATISRWERGLSSIPDAIMVKITQGLAGASRGRQRA